MEPFAAHNPTNLCLVADLPLLQHTSVLFSLMVKLGLEKSVLVPQLVVLRPVLLCLLEEQFKYTKWKLGFSKGNQC